MLRNSVLVLFCLLLRASAFDASPLVQFCTVPPAVPAADWWEGLDLTGVWPADDNGANGLTVTNRVSGADSAAIVGSDYRWTNFNGVACLDLGTYPPTSTHGAYVSCGDKFDLGTGGLATGGWVRPRWNSGTVFDFGKGNPFLGGCYSIRTVSTTSNGAYTAGANIGGGVKYTYDTEQPLATNTWSYVALVVDRPAGTLSLVKNGVVVSVFNTGVTTGKLDNAQPYCPGGSIFSGSCLNGSTRDVWIKADGTTNDAVNAYNASKARYGR